MHSPFNGFKHRCSHLNFKSACFASRHDNSKYSIRFLSLFIASNELEHASRSETNVSIPSTERFNPSLHGFIISSSHRRLHHFWNLGTPPVLLFTIELTASM